LAESRSALPTQGSTDTVAVIGGGIAGLASAHFLTSAGKKVTLFESSDRFGGLGTFFSYRGRFYERFYHCMLPGDNDLLELLGDLHIDQHVYWRPATFGYINNGTIHGLNTPGELLRFSPLPFGDRLRVGFTGLYGSAVSGRGLDDRTAVQWLTRLSGRRAFRMFWKPMLEAKFGSGYRDVPALWFWTRFNREKGTKDEIKGYIRGGYKFITDELVSSLENRGCMLQTNALVESLGLNEQGNPVVTIGREQRVFDKVIVTTPVETLRRMAGKGQMEESLHALDNSIDYQGVINVVLFLRRPLSNHYWIAAINDGLPFQGIVETSTLLDPEDTGGFSIVYLAKYLHRSHPEFSQTDDEIRAAYISGVRTLFPYLHADDIIEARVFRAPFVEPLYKKGYLHLKPPEELIPRRVYLATSTQVYPSVTSWNSSTGLAKRVAQRILHSD
jgi:protoporphyrinogen oxidase